MRGVDEIGIIIDLQSIFAGSSPARSTTQMRVYVNGRLTGFQPVNPGSSPGTRSS